MKKVAKELVDVARDLIATNEDYPYAALIFQKGRVEFRISFGGETSNVTGAEPYRRSVRVATSKVFRLLRDYGVKDENVEVIA